MQRRVANGAIRWIEVPIYGGSRPHHVIIQPVIVPKFQTKRVLCASNARLQGGVPWTVSTPIPKPRETKLIGGVDYRIGA
jgi:hypothetical protein